MTQAYYLWRRALWAAKVVSQLTVDSRVRSWGNRCPKSRIQYLSIPNQMLMSDRFELHEERHYSGDSDLLQTENALVIAA